MGGTDRRSDPTTDSRLYYSLVDPDCNCSGCFAVLVFFAEPIREVVPVNLILILILIHVLYLGIRKYLKVWRRDGWYS